MTRPEPSHDDHRWPSPPDPGDLSRRVAQRRAELHLSQAQVATRAGLSLRYLEYLERYPARPTAAALRQLAAALRTTPAALLGAGANAPPGQRHLADMRFISKLTPAECRRLITPGGVGRIAFGTLSGPVVVPVNFAVLADTIVVRTAEGTVIDGHANEMAALEVDHIDEALCQGPLFRGLPGGDEDFVQEGFGGRGAVGEARGELPLLHLFTAGDYHHHAHLQFLLS